MKKILFIVTILITLLATSCKPNYSYSLPPFFWEDSNGNNSTEEAINKAEEIGENLDLSKLTETIIKAKTTTKGITTEWIRTSSAQSINYNKYVVTATFTGGYEQDGFIIDSGCIQIAFDTENGNAAGTSITLKNFTATTLEPLKITMAGSTPINVEISFSGNTTGKIYIRNNDDGSFTFSSGSITTIGINQGSKITINNVTTVIEGPWKGGSNTSWYNPDAPQDSYSISTADELSGLASLVNSGVSFDGVTIKLQEDINLENIAWTPIGKLSNTEIESKRDESLVFSSTDNDFHGFKGIFDGQGKTIRNLSIQANNTRWFTPINSFKGLFGILEPGATIKNLNIENVSIEANAFTGIIAGYVPSSSTNQNPVILNNIHISGDISFEGYMNLGGLIGRSEAGSSINIENCSVIGNTGSFIKATSASTVSFVGGIIGAEYSSTDSVIENASVKNMNLSGYLQSVGGIAGNIFKTIVRNCTIENVTLSTTDDTWAKSMGAIAGSIGSDGQTSEAASQAGTMLTIEGTTTVKNISINYPFAENTGWQPFCNGFVGTYRSDKIYENDPSQNISGLPEKTAEINFIYNT